MKTQFDFQNQLDKLLETKSPVSPLNFENGKLYDMPRQPPSHITSGRSLPKPGERTIGAEEEGPSRSTFGQNENEKINESASQDEDRFMRAPMSNHFSQKAFEDQHANILQESENELSAWVLEKIA